MAGLMGPGGFGGFGGFGGGAVVVAVDVAVVVLTEFAAERVGGATIFS